MKLHYNKGFDLLYKVRERERFSSENNTFLFVLNCKFQGKLNTKSACTCTFIKVNEFSA